MGLIEARGSSRPTTRLNCTAWRSAAYRAYRRDRYQDLRFEGALPMAAQQVRTALSAERGSARDVKVRFVGVWDTVAAYGMPIYEMTAGIHKYSLADRTAGTTIWPKSIMRACQALALDEERTTFHPQLWNETTGNAVNGNAAGGRTRARALHQDERLEPGLSSQACIPMSAAVIPTMRWPTSPSSG